MAITTLDGALAGMKPPTFFVKRSTVSASAGRPFSFWGIAGFPGAGSYDNTLNGVTLSSTSAQVDGQIPFSDPVSANTYVARFLGHASSAGSLLLCDRIWHNGGFTISSTSAQNITSPTWPARDSNGSTNGDGVFLAVEVSSAVGNAAPTITIAYTNQAGTSSRSATGVDGGGNSAVAGSTFRIGLQAGDTGVRSVQSLTLSTSWSSGTINLVAFRPIAVLDLPFDDIGNELDLLTGGFARLYDGSVPYLMHIPVSGSSVKVQGSLIWTQG